MKNAWRAVVRPSVMRRLLVAQMAMLVLLWLGFLTLISYQSRSEDRQTTEGLARQGAALVLPLVAELADRPEQLQATLARIDSFQRAFQAPPEAQSPMPLPALTVWWDGQPIYRSPAPHPPDMPVTITGEMRLVHVDGTAWMQYAEDSAGGRARFVVMAPMLDGLVNVSIWSRTLLVLPLLVSLPLLVLPAWLSVRLALRPWRRLSDEIAARGPDDLSPLAFRPRHRDLSPLTRAVDDLLRRVREMRVRERAFIADAAHELRTPIAAMRVHVEALLGHALPARERELLHGLLTSNERAARLVEQLLSLSRSEAAARPPEPLDLEALIQDSLAHLAPLAASRDVELDLECERTGAVAPPLRGDAESLRSLVDNVVGNAIKYSPAGQAVRVRLMLGSEGARLSITDAGPGIPAVLRERVFDRFFRAADQAQAGSGLGLAIARAVAERHGAELTLGDGPDGIGLRVVLSLPAAAALPAVPRP